MDDIKAKQQIVEKIQASSNILVTVSNSPSVDELSAAIGLTLLLDASDKHATSVFSGTVPPAIAFLEPEKILDDTTDSLRDFIIALDKEKADHLRYKVEGDSVKIFITPYKTTITSDDLAFSQGDYNVELVIALGVDNQDHLDGALASHGQILHDATVITVTAGEQTSSLGGIDWHDDQASSLSEMIAGLGEALKTDKKKTLLDAQSATALLTGIVAQTDRFSNQHTTAKVMTLASQLMAAGADQQLIATKLSEGGQADEIDADVPTNQDELLVPRDNTKSDESFDVKNEQGSVDAGHVDTQVSAPVENPTPAVEQPVDPKPPSSSSDFTTNATPAGAYAFTDEPAASNPTITQDHPADHASSALSDDEAPLLGGSLSATTEQAADDARHAAENDQNKTILNHRFIQGGASSDDTNHEPPATGNNSFILSGTGAPVTPDAEMQPTTLPVVEQLLPVAPAPQGPPSPQDLGLPMPPPLPGAPIPAPVLTGPYALPEQPVDQPERLGDILAPEPTLPQPGIPAQPPAAPAAPTPPAGDPGQFKIPGQ